MILPCFHYQSVAFSAAFIPAIAFRPASGYRNEATGGLDNVGDRGYAWASSPYSAENRNAARLRFGADMADPLSDYNRSSGFAVRCVQHLPNCFSIPGNGL